MVHREPHAIPRVIISEKDPVHPEDIPVIAKILVHIFLFVTRIDINHIRRDPIIAEP